jgi:hypothetical protein
MTTPTPTILLAVQQRVHLIQQENGDFATALAFEHPLQ